MTPEDIALVKLSFGRLAPIQDDFGRIFYGRLFTAHPELRALFHGDLDQQAKALSIMMRTLVDSLEFQDKLVPLIHFLGARHAAARVRPEHYAPFGEALIWTLDAVLREEFTPATRRAWEEAYRFMADTMQ